MDSMTISDFFASNSSISHFTGIALYKIQVITGALLGFLSISVTTIVFGAIVKLPEAVPKHHNHKGDVIVANPLLRVKEP